MVDGIEAFLRREEDTTAPKDTIATILQKTPLSESLGGIVPPVGKQKTNVTSFLMGMPDDLAPKQSNITALLMDQQEGSYSLMPPSGTANVPVEQAPTVPPQKLSFQKKVQKGLLEKESYIVSMPGDTHYKGVTYQDPLTGYDWTKAAITSVLPIVGDWGYEYVDKVRDIMREEASPEDLAELAADDVALSGLFGVVIPVAGKAVQRVGGKAIQQISPSVRVSIKSFLHKRIEVKKTARKLVNKTSRFMGKEYKRIKLPQKIDDMTRTVKEGVEETASTAAGDIKYTTVTELKKAFREGVMGGEEILQKTRLQRKIKKPKPVIKLFETLEEARATKKITKEGVPLSKELLGQLANTEDVAGEWLDMQRLANKVDKDVVGLFHDEITIPLRQRNIDIDNFATPFIKEMYAVSKKLGLDFKKHRDIIRMYGEKTLPTKEINALPQKARVGIKQMNRWFRRGYDNLRIETNKELQKLGKPLIKYRNDYYTHMSDIEMLQQRYGGIKNAPAEVVAWFNKPRAIRAKMAIQRKKHELPEDLIQDAYSGFESYVGHSADIKYSSELISKLRGYATELRKAGKSPSMINILEKKADELSHTPIIETKTAFARKAVGMGLWLQNKFVKNQITGNFSVKVSQMLGVIQNAVVAAEKMPFTGGVRTMADYPKQLLVEAGESIYRHVVNPSYQSFAGKYCQVYKARAASGVEGIKQATKGKTLANFDASFLNFMDRIQVSSMFNVGYNFAYKRTKNHARAVAVGNDMASRAAAEFDKLMKPHVFSTAVGKFGMPIMTVPVNNFNLLMRDIGGKFIKKGVASKAVATAQVANMYAASVVLNGATRLIMGQPKFTAMDLIPFYGPVKYGVGGALNLPITAMRVIDGQIGPIDAAYRMSWSFVPPRYGAQLYKTFEGMKAIKKGGKFNKKGDMQFPVQGADAIRALFFGPYGTREGGKYLEKLRTR